MLEDVDLFCHLRCDKPACVLGPVRKTLLIRRYIVTDKALCGTERTTRTGNVNITPIT